MNMQEYLWQLPERKNHGAMPVLSFPAVQKMGVTVRELVNSAKLQAQAMKTVAEETPSAAAVSLMDLSVEAEAFGAQVVFSDNEVPVITGQLVSDAEGAEALVVPEVGAGRTGLCVEALRMAKQQITDRPVFAGVIGPYSLAGRLMDVTEVMYLCYDEPETVHAVLEKATEFLTKYILTFKETGVDGVVMAEPLAGLLSAQMSDEFSCKYVKRIVEEVQTDDFVVIYHNCGNNAGGMLKEVFATNAAAYHFGNAVNMHNVLRDAPADKLCMGNIDPAGQFAHGTPESMRESVKALIADLGDKPNWVLSSGCDIPPHAKWENIMAFFEAAN